jgi:hypothetical protein
MTTHNENSLQDDDISSQSSNLSSESEKLILYKRPQPDSDEDINFFGSEKISEQAKLRLNIGGNWNQTRPKRTISTTKS